MSIGFLVAYNSLILNLFNADGPKCSKKCCIHIEGYLIPQMKIHPRSIGSYPVRIRVRTCYVTLCGDWLTGRTVYRAV